jgi:hypothetical protein
MKCRELWIKKPANANWQARADEWNAFLSEFCTNLPYQTLMMMVLLFLSTFSYLKSDSFAKILQRLVVSSSLNVIAAATDATGHWLASLAHNL